MNEPHKVVASIPCERGGSFELREVQLRRTMCMQLYFENPDGRSFSRFIFSNQVEPLRDAINAYLASREAEKTDE